MDKFTVTAQGIKHNESPAFVANWFSGDEAQENKDQNSFYYEASGGFDQLLISQIEWQNEKPNQEQFNQIMDEAITAIDSWIAERF